MTRAKKIYLGLAALILTVVSATALSYALYQQEVDVGVVTTAGEMICDIEVDTNENYIENNEAYFYINVVNYEAREDGTYISATDVDYTITIENTGSDQGYFRYTDEEGNTNGEGETTAVINSSIGNDSVETKRYRVYVTGSNDLKQDIDFKVSLDAKQKNMEE